MSVASPARPSAARAPRSPRVVEDRPLRNPPVNSREAMSRRGRWLVVLNFLVPGSAQVLAGSRRLGRFALGTTIGLWSGVVVAALLALLWRQAFVTVAMNWFVLLAVQVLLLAYAALWFLLTVDTLRLVRLVKTGGAARFGIVALAAVLLVVSGGGAAYAAQVAGTARATLGSIFGTSGPAVPPSDGYYNILLLGADSGDGRDSMRFDSISVVSVNAETGATTITGIPRDLPGVPFSEGPMRDLYPDGFTGHGDQICGWYGNMNHVRHAAEVCREDGGSSLYPDAFVNGSEPGIEATKDAAEGVLGIEIPYYVFIDMHGFAALIDALGGVEITVEQRLPKGGGPAYDGQPAEDWAIGWIEPGTQRMDGDTAQWYARSRYTTSDWDRMVRQRVLQQAILAQFSPANVLTRFDEIAAAGQDIVRTDVPQSLLPFLAELAIKAQEQPVTTIELTPDGGVDEHEPDFAHIHDLIRGALHPPAPSPDPGS